MCSKSLLRFCCPAGADDQVFDKAKSPEDAAAADGPDKGEDEPKAADTTPILHRIQEAVLQVKQRASSRAKAVGIHDDLSAQ